MLHKIQENTKVLSKSQQKFINAGGGCPPPLIDPCSPVQDWDNKTCQCGDLLS